MSDIQERPYQTLGKHLRYLREQQAESLAEVSGAVEIDTTALERIEAGHERPAEDILMLLISHFDMQDQEAVQLWELAGYDGNANNERHKQEEILQDALQGNKPVIFLMGIDGRTMYTDTAKIIADKAGVTMNFGKINGKKNSQSVASVGMSYDQAHEVLRQLQSALLHGRHSTRPKLLPPPSEQ